jgi:hypothetical protein
MIYIVSWLVIVYSIVTCPNNLPYTDDYGITHIPQSITCQLCYDSDTSFHNREFTSRKEAEEFIKNAPKPTLFEYHQHGYCENMKLDSLDAWCGPDTTETEMK